MFHNDCRLLLLERCNCHSVTVRGPLNRRHEFEHQRRAHRLSTMMDWARMASKITGPHSLRFFIWGGGYNWGYNLSPPFSATLHSLKQRQQRSVDTVNWTPMEKSGSRQNIDWVARPTVQQIANWRKSSLKISELNFTKRLNFQERSTKAMCRCTKQEHWTHSASSKHVMYTQSTNHWTQFVGTALKRLTLSVATEHTSTEHIVWVQNTQAHNAPCNGRYN